MRGQCAQITKILCSCSLFIFGTLVWQAQSGQILYLFIRYIFIYIYSIYLWVEETVHSEYKIKIPKAILQNFIFQDFLCKSVLLSFSEANKLIMTDIRTK